MVNYLEPMTNLDIIELIGHALNEAALDILKDNDIISVQTWEADILDTVASGDMYFEVPARNSNTGNPILVSL